MAGAMVRGWLATAAAEGPPGPMLFTDGGSGRARALAELSGGEAVGGLGELAARSELIVLAVKPKGLQEAGSGLEDFGGPVVSVLGATPLSALREALPQAHLLRTMPNFAVEVGRGLICHAPPADPGALAPALELLGRIGRLYELEESLLDVATAVMGCSPAYFAVAAGAVAEAGAVAGLEHDLAAEFAARSLIGAGELLLERDPAELCEVVASPGGSTEAGLEALAAARAAAGFERAVVASLERMAGTR